MSIESSPRRAAASFVEGVRIAQGAQAEQKVLRSARPELVGPVVRVGDKTVAQVVYYPARVQATFEGKPVFAEKVDAVVGIEVTTKEVKDGKDVSVSERYPYSPDLRAVPDNIVSSLAEGIKLRA